MFPMFTSKSQFIDNNNFYYFFPFFFLFSFSRPVPSSAGRCLVARPNIPSTAIYKKSTSINQMPVGFVLRAVCQCSVYYLVALSCVLCVVFLRCVLCACCIHIVFVRSLLLAMCGVCCVSTILFRVTLCGVQSLWCVD